jgi:protoheme IX farnesyltransferase
MKRTAKRPLPAGRMDRQSALHFGVGLAFFAVILMELATNRVAAFILAVSILFYVLVYTIWLKRRTPQNIVIGGAAGAFPPVIGWAAATGHVGLESVLLFLIVFLWTPPHFWALSLIRAGDYARAGVPMLPVVAGRAETKRQIVLYTAVLVPVSLAPWFLGYAGAIYGVVAIAAGVMLAALAWRLRTAADEQTTAAASRRLFGFSILYLFALFAALLGDRAIGVLAAG